MDQQYIPQPIGGPSMQLTPSNSLPVSLYNGNNFGANKNNLVEKAKKYIEQNAGMVLALIVILTIVIIALFVYYHGLFGVIGPFDESKASKKAVSSNNSKKKVPDDTTDTETENLIKSINSAATPAVAAKK